MNYVKKNRKPKNLNLNLSPPLKYFTDRSKAVLLCGSFLFFCFVFAMPLCVSVYMCLVVTFWKKD